MSVAENPYESPQQRLANDERDFWHDSRWAIIGIVIALVTIGSYDGALVMATVRINFFPLSLLGIAAGVASIRNRKCGCAIALAAILFNVVLLVVGFWMLYEWNPPPKGPVH